MRLPVLIQLQPPVLIQLQPITARPVTGQLDIGPITTVCPIAEQLDYGPITTVHYITEQLDFSFIDIPCNFYTALYWINKYISILPAHNLRFKACYKYNNINLPLF